MIAIKNSDELARMRVSGRLAAEVRDQVADRIRPGVTTRELDDYALALLRQRNAKSAFFGYRGYPAQVCLSVNDEIVHGVPGNRRIAVGDVVSLDVGVLYDGFIGDTATTVMVNVTDPATIRLVETTERALMAALAEACSGACVGDLSHAVERIVRDEGFSVVREFVGHGIGRRMHEEPQVPNYGAPGRGPRLHAGMTLAIEPIVSLRSRKWDLMDDGWTVRTRDAKPAAHFEHTIAIGSDRVEILTLGEKKEKK